MDNLQELLNSQYKESLRTLKKTSHDIENNIYMCESRMKVIDFDILTKILNPIKQPSSADALLIDENLKNIYCIEFKNQNKSAVKNRKVQKKAKDGKETLVNICEKHSLELTAYKIIFCVVYKSNPNKREYQNRYDNSSIHFGLEPFEGLYFDNVVTNNIDYFTLLFKEKYEND